jgi:hypothetical protein
MSQINKYYSPKSIHFHKFKLLGLKTSNVSVINVKTISRLDVRSGRATCVYVTHFDRQLSAGAPSPGLRQRLQNRQ